MRMVGRENQKQRTREALFEAALRLSRQGRQNAPIADVADEARVSTATAYRYFPNPQALWADLAVWQAPRLAEILHALPDGDVESRLEALIRAVTRMQFADEALWRAVLRATLDRWFHEAASTEYGRTDDPVPVRSSTRLDTTRELLAPLAGALTADQLERLTRAVVLVYGVEAMVVSRDALDLDQAQAADVMTWAAGALVRAALAEAGPAAPSASAITG
jgi:AcrR family transcriptional regulator